MIDASNPDFRKAFRCRFSPKFAGQIEAIIDSSAVDARTLCEVNFKSGNFGVTQGVNRWQFIDDRCETTTFDGGVIAESREFSNGKLMDVGSNKNKITVLRSGTLGLAVCKVDEQNPIPKPAFIKTFMSSLAYPSRPLFGNMFQGHMPSELKAVFFACYNLDEEDSENAMVSKIEVVALNRDAKSIRCVVCDLRDYATEAVIEPSKYVYNEPLPIAFRDFDSIKDTDQDSEGEDLPITKRRTDLDELN